MWSSRLVNVNVYINIKSIRGRAAGLDLAEKIERIETAVAVMNETFDSVNLYEASRAEGAKSS